MRRAFLGLAAFAVACVPAFAGGNTDSTIWISQMQSAADSGWVVAIPAGSSDYFNVKHPATGGIGNVNDTVVTGLNACGVAVSVADFAGTFTYPTVGLFQSNTGLDATGNTPDLSLPIAVVNSPALPNPPAPLFTFVGIQVPETDIPDALTEVHAVVQFPPGDSGSLGVGADTTTPSGVSGFTTDGYTTPAITASFLAFGINAGQDNSATTSCKQGDRKPHGRLRVSSNTQGVGQGDHLTLTVRGGDLLSLAFWGTKTGDKWRIYFNGPGCAPAIPIGPILNTLPEPDGDGSYLRLPAISFPAGFGGNTFQFSAVWGNSACANPGVGFTNCVTVIVPPDLPFGRCDDGTVESGWVVNIPSQSSDYFNNRFIDTGINGVDALTIGVRDFGSNSQFPASGIAPANLGLDATGGTPDLAASYVQVTPFTFPPGTFATSSPQYTTHAVPPTAVNPSNGFVHGWVQFPPGDSGQVSVGGDTTQSNGCSFFTLDGYTSPALSFFVNWAIRVSSN